MNDNNLEQLKQQIETLLELRSQVITENKLLHKKLSDMAQESALLLRKKSNAVSKLQIIIKRLKEELS